MSTPDWGPAFLTSLRKQGTVYHAAVEAGVNRGTVYQRLKSDSAFKLEYDAAVEDALDVMEREAIRRGVEGYLEPIVHQGRIMGDWQTPDGQPCDPDDEGAVFVPSCLRKYSDRLLSSLLRWKRYPDPRQATVGDEEPEFQQEE